MKFWFTGLASSLKSLGGFSECVDFEDKTFIIWLFCGKMSLIESTFSVALIPACGAKGRLRDFVWIGDSGFPKLF